MRIWSWQAVDRVAEVMFVVVCVGLAATAGIRHWSGLRGGEGAERLAAVEVDAVQGVRPATNKTVLVIVDTSCVHCTLSMPFYARLAATADGSAGRLRVVFAARESADRTRAYLETNGITKADVMGRPANVQVRGTPTLYVLDRSGRVVAGWYGRLNVKQEAEVLAGLD